MAWPKDIEKQGLWNYWCVNVCNLFEAKFGDVHLHLKCASAQGPNNFIFHFYKFYNVHVRVEVLTQNPGQDFYFICSVIKQFFKTRYTHDQGICEGVAL